MSRYFAERTSRDQVELGTEFAPLFNEEGLIPCITVDATSGEILMFAWMNEEALRETLHTGRAVYYSRSRQQLWVKGETSGRTQKVRQVLVDCDQDVIQLRVDPAVEGACHRGYRSCFYRAVSERDSRELKFIDEKPSFNPETVYGD